MLPRSLAESRKYIKDKRIAMRSPNTSRVSPGTYLNFSPLIRIKNDDINTTISARPVFNPANLKDCQGSRMAKQINKNSSRPNLVVDVEDEKELSSFLVI